MSTNIKYHTTNRSHFLQAAQSFNRPFTAKDIIDMLQANNNPIGTSTVYRLLDEFSSNGILQKTLGTDNVSTYFYSKPCASENHFYLECEKCHRLRHIDCRHLRAFSKHLAKKHCFTISNYSLVIRGICKNCAKEQS